MRTNIDKIYMVVLEKLKKSKEGKVVSKLKKKQLQDFFARLYEMLYKRMASGEWKDLVFDPQLKLYVEAFKKEADKIIEETLKAIEEKPIESEDLLEETPPGMQELEEIMTSDRAYAVQEIDKTPIEEEDISDEEFLEEAEDIEEIDEEAIELKMEETSEFKMLMESLKAAPEEIQEYFEEPKNRSWLIREFSIYWNFIRYDKLKRAGMLDEAEPIKERILEFIKHFYKRDLEARFNEYAEKVNKFITESTEKGIEINQPNLLLYLYERAKVEIPEEVKPEDVQEHLYKIAFHEDLTKLLQKLRGTPLEKSRFRIAVDTGLKPIGLEFETPVKVETLTPNLYLLLPSHEYLTDISYCFRWLFTTKEPAVSFAKLWWLITRYDPVMNLYTHIPSVIGEELSMPYYRSSGAVILHRNWADAIAKLNLKFISLDMHRLTVKDSAEAVEEIKKITHAPDTTTFVLLTAKLIDSIVDKTLLSHSHTQSRVLNPVDGQFYTIYKGGITPKFLELLDKLSFLGIDDVEIHIPSETRGEIKKEKVRDIIRSAKSSQTYTVEIADLMYRLQRLIFPPYSVYDKFYLALSAYFEKIEGKILYPEEFSNIGNILRNLKSDYLAPEKPFESLVFPNFYEYLSKFATEGHIVLKRWRELWQEGLKSIDEDMLTLSGLEYNEKGELVLADEGKGIKVRSVLATLYVASRIGLSIPRIDTEVKNKINSSVAKIGIGIGTRYDKLKEKHKEDFFIYFDYKKFADMVFPAKNVYLLGQALPLEKPYRERRSFTVYFTLPTESLSEIGELDLYDEGETIKGHLKELNAMLETLEKGED